MSHGALRSLPRVDDLLREGDALVRRFGRPLVTQALRSVLDEARAQIRAGGRAPDVGQTLDRAADALERSRPDALRPVVNATGVVVHTNLGRAPLSQRAMQALHDAAGACALEYDLDRGVRGSRESSVRPLLRHVTGAEDGFAVNNAAAALVLALAALAAGREVVVSRGELVEIGGSFRLPDIMRAAGVRLVEVGTTNRTRAGDYAEALQRPDGDVGMLLVVHPSNFRVTGFTEAADLADLAALAQQAGVPLVHDVGSGLLEPAPETWLRDEPSVTSSLEQGAGLVLCSGDKLLGGPQAGLLVGDAELVERCRRHPLARALRLDKLRVGALAATLASYAAGRPEELPVWAMLRHDPEGLARRCGRLADAFDGEVVAGASLVGGGAAPGAAVPGPVVRLTVDDADHVAHRLRTGSPAVVVRVSDGALVVDLRSVAEDDDHRLERRLREETGRRGGGG